jgi:crossover junction endodeoxyribonuclease RuvC
MLEGTPCRTYDEHVFERVVLGADPGMAATGLAAVSQERGKPPRVLWADTVRTSAEAPEAERLRDLHEAVRSALTAHGPEALAIERLMWGRNVGSAMGVARASGVLMVGAAAMGIPVREYAPLEVKMAVTGSGAAGKEAVRRSLSRLLGVEGVPSQPDAADATAVAVCHLAQASARRAVRMAR